MRILVPQPSPVIREYTAGGVPVNIPSLSLSPQEHTDIASWVYAAFSPNGTDTLISVYLDGTGSQTPTVDDGTIITGLSQGDGMPGDGLHFLRVRARRKVGSTGSISAQTIYFRVDVSLSCTVDPATELIACTRHGLVENDVVRFGGSVVPTGLSGSTDYWVIASGLTQSVFKVSATRGGSAVNITTAGTAVRLLLGVKTIATLNVLAAAADEDPVTDWVEQPFVDGCRYWSFSSTDPLLVYLDVSDADLEIQIEAAGDN